MIRYEMRSPALPREEEVIALARTLAIEPTLARMLLLRGCGEPEAARAFLHPDMALLEDPFVLPDMDRAAARIERACRTGELIAVYGDYDVDGVCATSILVEYLRDRGAAVEYYVPDRHREGYGLHGEAVRALAVRGVRLLVTVDCGIASLEEVRIARTLGMDVVVTDHHECPAELPEAVAVVDPKRPDAGEKLSRLCGAGVAGCLVRALGGAAAMERSLDLMALATVADMVPLVEENRAIVAGGLQKMRTGTRLGLQALVAAASLEAGSLNAGHLGFQLGPRINAGGRMDSSTKSVELMTTGDGARAEAIARELEADNTRRKALGDTMAREAEEMTARTRDLSRERAIVLWCDHWDSGVQGIVASRLVERFHRPTILMTREEGRYVGSARSIAGVHMFHALEACADLLVRFGGHEMAAGMTVLPENLEAFRARFNRVLTETTEAACYLPGKKYDLALPIGAMNETLVEQLELLAPFGMGNPAPVFRVRGQLGDIRTMGNEGQHFRATLADGTGVCGAVAFRREAPRGNSEYDLLVSLGIDEWRGRRTLRCQIQDCQPRPMSPAEWAGQVSASQVRQGMLSQLLLPEEPTNIPWEEDPLPWLEEDAFGTLVLAHQPETLVGLAPLPVYHTAVQTAEGAAAGQNTLVIAPDYARLAEGGPWRSLILLDAPLSRDAAKTLAGQLRCERIGSIMKYPPFDGRNLWPGFGQEALRAAYVGLRSYLRSVPRFFRQEDIVPALADALALERGQVRLALAIFRQLGLVAYGPEAPYLALIPGKKVTLEESTLYQRAVDCLAGRPGGKEEASS